MVESFMGFRSESVFCIFIDIGESIDHGECVRAPVKEEASVTTRDTDIEPDEDREQPEEDLEQPTWSDTKYLICQQPNERVVSGFRSESNFCVFIDVNQAIRDGIKFYRSANDVILTRGNDGLLPPKYFQKTGLNSTAVPTA